MHAWRLFGIDIVRMNAGGSNSVVRLQNYINRKHPLVVDGMLNLDHRKLPEIEGDKFLLTKEEFCLIAHYLDEENSCFLNRLAPGFCNDTFPVSEELDLARLMELIYECLPEFVSPQTVDWLRSQAVLSEKSGNIKQAKDLMSLACFLRPTGEFIKQKLDEYKNRLRVSRSKL